MVRIVAGLFLVVHGLVHLLYVTPPPKDDPKYPFVPEERWFTRAVGLAPAAAKGVARTLAIVCVALFVIAGIALLANASLWKPTAVGGSLVSLVLMLLFFHPRLVFGVAIDVAIVASVLFLHVPASLFED